MWQLVLFLAFGVPGEHERYARAPVAQFSDERACNEAIWEWYRDNRIPARYAPRWRQDETHKGWFMVGPPFCRHVRAPRPMV